MSEAECMNTCPEKNGCQVMAMLDVLEGHEEAIRWGGIESLIDVENPADLEGVLAVEDHFRDMVSGKVEAPQGISMYAFATKKLIEFGEDVAESCAGPKLKPRHPLLRAIGLRQPKEVCGQTIRTEEFYERLAGIIQPIFADMEISITAYGKDGNAVPLEVRMVL